MESKPAKEKILCVVDTLGEAENVGGLNVVVAMEVPEPVLVSNTFEMVAGEVTIVVERVELVKVVATVVGGTVVVLVEDVVLEVEEAVVVVEAKPVVGTMVVLEEELVDATILARRFFNKVMSSSHEIFCAK